MARLRFYNGKVLKNYSICDEEVWIENDRITTKIGPFDREINLHGNLIMPSFKNAHAHSAMVFLRSLADDVPLQEWLETKVWPNEAKLTDESVYYFTKLAILEQLSSGISASFDMYVKNDAYMQVMNDTGFKGIICSGLNNFDADITNIEREFLKFPGKFVLGIHAEYTTCMDRMKYCVELANKYKVPCYSHLCETKAEVQGCIDRYGKTPPQLLDEIGFFEYGGGGFHCCYMTDEDIELFSRKNLYAVSCPGSNLKLGSGIAPIEKMRKSEVKIALGTDGAASNNSLDMWREMYLVSALQKGINEDPTACPAKDVLEMACKNSAYVMGLNDSDDIVDGKKADLVVINLNSPNMVPDINTISNLVYAGNKSNVLMTLVDGKILYENGEFNIGESAQDIYRNSSRLIKEILN